MDDNNPDTKAILKHYGYNSDSAAQTIGLWPNDGTAIARLGQLPEALGLSKGCAPSLGIDTGCTTSRYRECITKKTPRQVLTTPDRAYKPIQNKGLQLDYNISF